MGFDTSDVRRILEAFEASNWEYIHLSTSDFEIKISSKSGTIDEREEIVFEREVTKSSDSLGERATIGNDAEAESIPAELQISQRNLNRDHSASDLVRITAPTVGIFWASPSPGAPPFAKVGQLLEPDSTVAIVEVMKLMNHIKAGVSGRVVETVAQNGKAVEAGDVLFLIEVESDDLSRGTN
ncbi:biotin/lipoyl-containing protein [Acidithrix ferrooxidans]|uniref:Biotin carboxyl carrier protein of acetyl-CoA carboxylase n=1 Tax=Acidithrix ferrooxidans TaxID=1280514 RepID=A0A0D8HLD4_9ACTN|nr:biotin/lipoyl-containing protein [Acidithrix ferrooxidans]KJF18659.1 biotin carboxyl carrier protein of acetyl-CoA carboxylase [Acidithrix ferrooxidans]